MGTAAGQKRAVRQSLHGLSWEAEGALPGKTGELSRVSKQDLLAQKSLAASAQSGSGLFRHGFQTTYKTGLILMEVSS